MELQAIVPVGKEDEDSLVKQLQANVETAATAVAKAENQLAAAKDVHAQNLGMLQFYSQMKQQGVIFAKNAPEAGAILPFPNQNGSDNYAQDGEKSASAAS